MWKAPNRPNNAISQTYNDGMVSIYEVRDTAAAGYQPVETQTLKFKLPYSERKLGIQRFYSARQNQTEVSRVIRVPHTAAVSNLDTAVTEDGVKYRIDLVQLVPDAYPASDDLTLVRFSQGGDEA